MKILLLGAGATGGYFGGRLVETGADVSFLVREKRAQHIAVYGLQIEHPQGRSVMAVHTVLAEAVKPEYDVVLLACKAYDLATSIEAIRPAMGPRTQVIPLLNGMTHLETLDSAFGASRVMGGLCQIAATLTKDGVVKSLANSHVITWGAREPAQQATADALALPFSKTVVTWKVSENIVQDMWEKVVFLSTLAATTCLMRANVGEILATENGAAIMQRCLDSCIAIATKSGFPPRAKVLERYQTSMAATGSTTTASMLRDIESGMPVEADHIVGFMLARARALGIDDTILAVAYAHLKAYENRRAGNRLG